MNSTSRLLPLLRIAQMATCADIADHVWLTGEEACALLDELAGDRSPLHTLIARLRGHCSAERTRLLVEQVELRRRASAKFNQPHRMFFTRVGLEQATDEWVAAYKAVRMAQAGQPLADLCCGVGGDLLALAGQGSAIGIDIDPIAAHFAAANTGATIHCTDAARFDLSDFAVWHIDPDRRPSGRRTTSIEFCQPNLDAIEQLLQRGPDAAIKLAPATQVPAHWSADYELEWISRDRECRQLVAWRGNLAQAPGQHRATILPARYGTPLARGLALRTISGTPDQLIPIAAHIDCYIFDIDTAVLAAHLSGTLAAEHYLNALSAGPTYLTGTRPIGDAALACFAVSDVLPFDRHKLARHLRERSIGQLEIKKRGVVLDPEQLRRDLKLRGNNAATLLITRIATRPTAILAHRVS